MNSLWIHEWAGKMLFADYKTVVMGAAMVILNDTFKEHYENMEISGTYEI
ncbi:hypothetical protein [Aquibacillus rhizosphaerae]|uniref:Uncharacterized protein n=1 Tax=Aquibacillus rhizosphaerae TaxID=3051431 RepID=A0ABT7LDT2_9BACI|nr:hypothetical protein [Aquibacillus sp. LR5S19]MDL4842706.1 hypothetical protein [Aquibacillus sp. LR5S19]